MNSLGMSVMISHPGAGSIENQISVFADAGFDSFFLSCGVTNEFVKIPEWSETAARCGISFEAVHLPSDYLAAMWGSDTEQAEKALMKYTDIIHLCGSGGVDKAVLHSAVGNCAGVSERGLERFTMLEEKAESCGVHICYENSNMPEHLAALISHAGHYHGFCLDTGHRNCYTPDDDLLSMYGSRLLYTHIHDNDGKSDLHYLPFDGTVDWNSVASALRKCGYSGTLNAELSANLQSYRQTDYPEFACETYRRLIRLRNLM